MTESGSEPNPRNWCWTNHWSVFGEKGRNDRLCPGNVLAKYEHPYPSSCWDMVAMATNILLRSRRWQNLHAVFSVFRPFSKLDTHKPGWLWDLITLRRDTLATQSKLQSVRTTTTYNLSTLTPFWSLGHFLSFKTKPDTYNYYIYN